MREKEVIPGYTVDRKGFRAELGIHPFLGSIGVWRPITIEQGRLVIMQPKGGEVK